MAFVLGIDVSTTATKAVLVDEAGAVAGIGTAAYPVSTPQPGWSEQDPRLWWEGTREAMAALLAATGARPADIVAIGLTGQMHGAVLLDAAGEVLRPAILWNDQRTAAECDLIRERVGFERLVATTGNDALTGFTAAKLVWVQRHEPETWARVAHVLLPKDYVRYRLTGEFATDKADGSGTQLFDLAARDWSAAVLSALEIEPGLLPATHEGPEVTGALTGSAAAASGLMQGTPIIAGGGDQAANAVGVGAVVPGVTALSLGTSGVVFATTERPIFEPQGRVHAFCHARPRTLAHDVGDALRGRQPALVPRRPGSRRVVRRPHGCGGRGAGRDGRPLLPALPDRRAQPLPRSRGPRCLRWPDHRS